MIEWKRETICRKMLEGKTRSRQVFSTLWNNCVVIENPDSFQPTDVTRLFTIGEKNQNAWCSTWVAARTREQSWISRVKLPRLPVGLSISSGTLPPLLLSSIWHMLLCVVWFINKRDRFFLILFVRLKM